MNYRITGSLVGCLPGHSYQNSQLGVPLQLMREEANILIENKICKLMQFNEKRYETVNKEVSAQFEDQRNKSFLEYKKLLKDERVQQMKRKCEEIAAGKKKRRTEMENVTLTENECIEQEIKRLPEVTYDLFPIQMFTRCPSLSGYSDAEEFIDITSQWDYPQSEDEICKYRIFKDLWSKGYFLTNGFKFGCDYLVYESDPCMCHAKYMVVCVADNELSSLNLHILGRLSGQVNKQVLIASIAYDGNINYESLNCDAIRNPFKLK
ncbi:tRNA-splicing endonuclease subunit Sen34-like protein [Leptotrombidium deliense]|uniref:tRNA-splicing endonuclease subunit Sen34 n=1 Tax=Leptotrombidium deliense TaxID=299467 RepID=A0A443SNW7_9ACAR|nr:tRNA-splicing endonuclease subunit Sen34-like protein [Leptotrombidium deliense]